MLERWIVVGGEREAPLLLLLLLQQVLVMAVAQHYYHFGNGQLKTPSYHCYSRVVRFERRLESNHR